MLDNICLDVKEATTDIENRQLIILFRTNNRLKKSFLFFIKFLF